MRVHAVTTNWCHPALTESFVGPASNRAYRQCIENRKLLRADLSNYDVVILGGHWGHLQAKGLLNEVTSLLSALAEKDETDVIIMASPEQYVRRTVEATFFGKRTRPAIDPHLERQALAANMLLADVAISLPNTSYIGRDVLFGDSITSDALPYSFDGQHISIYGSRKAAERYIAFSNSN